MLVIDMLASLDTALTTAQPTIVCKYIMRVI